MRNAHPTSTVLVWPVGGSMPAAGPVLVLRSRQGRAQLKSELAQQRISFFGRDALPATFGEFTGQPVDSGARARTHSGLIKANLRHTTRGRAYAELRRALHEGGGADENPAKPRETAFTGETPRASLLGAYQAANLTELVVGLGALLTGLGAVVLVMARGHRPGQAHS